MGRRRSCYDDVMMMSTWKDSPKCGFYKSLCGRMSMDRGVSYTVESIVNCWSWQYRNVRARSRSLSVRTIECRRKFLSLFDKWKVVKKWPPVIGNLPSCKRRSKEGQPVLFWQSIQSRSLRWWCEPDLWSKWIIEISPPNDRKTRCGPVVLFYNFTPKRAI